MRIFTKKSYGFVNPDTSIPANDVKKIVRTEPLGFKDVPDWVKKDPMFIGGVQSGNIEVIEKQARSVVPKNIKKAK